MNNKELSAKLNYLRSKRSHLDHLDKISAGRGIGKKLAYAAGSLGLGALGGLAGLELSNGELADMVHHVGDNPIHGLSTGDKLEIALKNYGAAHPNELAKGVIGTASGATMGLGIGTAITDHRLKGRYRLPQHDIHKHILDRRIRRLEAKAAKRGLNY